jgi:plasmid replication initiation protein
VNVLSKKNILKKHTGAIHINNKLSALERKISNVLLKHAYKNLMTQDQHALHLLELVQDIGWNSASQVTTHLFTAIERLNETQLKWNILGKDKKRRWGVSTLLASAEIKEGVVYYSYSSKFKEWLSNPSLYASLNLDFQKKLTGKYSLALWEFASEQLDSVQEHEIQTPFFNLSDLRELLGAEENTYSEYRYFNTKVVKAAIKEVNLKTDLNISVIASRNIRKVEALAFKIERHMVQTELFNENVDTINFIQDKLAVEDIIGKGTSFLQLEENFLMRCVSQHGIQKVSEAISFVLERIENDAQIENITAYFYKVLDNGIMHKVSSETIRPQIMQQLSQNAHDKEKSAVEFVLSTINAEKNKYLKIILTACYQTMPILVVQKGLQEGAFIIESMEDNCESIKILLSRSARYSGYRDKVLTVAGDELKRLGYKFVDIKIKDIPPEEMAKIAREMTV